MSRSSWRRFEQTWQAIKNIHTFVSGLMECTDKDVANNLMLLLSGGSISLEMQP